MDMNTEKIIHDIRNPLNTISMNAELGKLSMLRNPDPQKLVAIFEIILKECRICSDQLSNLKESLSEGGSDLNPNKGLTKADNKN
jgi:signal transduction histidine kinase